MKKILGLILFLSFSVSSFASQIDFIGEYGLRDNADYVLEESLHGVTVCYMGSTDLDKVFDSMFEVGGQYASEENSFVVTGYRKDGTKLIVDMDVTDEKNWPDESYGETAILFYCDEETRASREKEIAEDKRREDDRNTERERIKIGPPPIVNDGEIIYIESEGISVLGFATDPETKYPNIDPHDLCYIADSDDSVEEAVELLVEEGVMLDDSETGELQQIYYNPDSRSYDVELYASKIEDEGEHPYYTASIYACKNAPEERDFVAASYKFELQNMMIDEDYEPEFYGFGLCMSTVYDEEFGDLDYKLEDADFNKALDSLNLTWELEGIYGESTASIELYTLDKETGDSDEYIGAATMNICE